MRSGIIGVTAMAIILTISGLSVAAVSGTAGYKAGKSSGLSEYRLCGSHIWFTHKHTTRCYIPALNKKG